MHKFVIENLWFWYLLGIVITLVWKWQRYCYEQKGCSSVPRTFWESSLEWWELTTLGSQVSWGATLGGTWLLGYVLITKKGAEWLFGGILMDVPNVPPMLFFVGAIQEMIVPAVMKWVVSKLTTLK
jgi:hypothetical protein